MYLSHLPARSETIQELKRRHSNGWLQLVAEYKGYWDARKTHNMALCLFVELSRMHFIIQYQSLMDETKRIAACRSDEAVGDSDMILIYDDAIKDVPIMRYKQSQIQTALLYITERLDSMPWTSMPYMERIFHILYTRNSSFLCEHAKGELLDVPGMRDEQADGLYTPNFDYLMFCTIYFHAIRRRLTFGRKVPKRSITFVPDTGDDIGKHIDTVDPRLIERTKQWFETIVCGSGMGRETFDDCYQKSSVEGFRFPGDAHWYKHRFPDLPVRDLGPILDCSRKEQAKLFYTEYRLSLETILAAMDQENQTGHCARIFFLNAVDMYMRIHFNGIAWRDALVIPNHALESSQERLLRGGAPYLVQFYSRYIVYDDGFAYPSDSVYESFTFWLMLVDRKYKGQLFYVSLQPLINKLLL